MRKRLTDRLLDDLKPKTKRYLVYDTIARSLAVRVSPSGRKAFVIVGRFGAKHSTRKSLGAGVTLDEARALAHSCHKNGISPPRGPTFGEVAAQFLKHIKHQRRVRDATGIINREFLPRWADRPLSDIKRADIIAITDAIVQRGHEYSAHYAWAYCRRIYNWAIARGLVEHSPCDRVRPRDIIGEKLPRRRVLTDDELARMWIASGELGYPMGPLFRLLMVTGQRRTEVGMARVAEFNIGAQVWQPPSSRMKSGASHMVPLSPLALSIIEGLPQHDGYLFSTTGGRTHISGYSKAKKRLDALMGTTPPFVIHDIRRTVRTRLSQLRVRHEVAELVIAHGKKGLARVYDQHEYREEVREALAQWSLELLRIINTHRAGRSEIDARRASSNAQSAALPGSA